jgi:hypothetical protein
VAGGQWHRQPGPVWAWFGHPPALSTLEAAIIRTSVDAGAFHRTLHQSMRLPCVAAEGQGACAGPAHRRAWQPAPNGSVSCLLPRLEACLTAGGLGSAFGSRAGVRGADTGAAVTMRPWGPASLCAHAAAAPLPTALRPLGCHDRVSRPAAGDGLLCRRDIADHGHGVSRPAERFGADAGP